MTASHLALIVLLTRGLLGQVSVTKSGASPEGPLRAEAEVLSATEELNNALSRSDASVLDVIYAEEYVHIDRDGQVTTKAERLAGFRSSKHSVVPLPRNPGALPPRIHVYGDVAVVTSQGRARVTSEGRSTEASPVTLTRLWTKRNGRWQLVLAQTTPVVSQAKQN